MSVWLARHGETESNRLHILQGALDIPLNATGELQAQQLAGRMKSFALSSVYSSHLSRAKSTAQAIATAASGERAIEVEIDSRLGEFNCGVFQGLGRAAAQEQYPREWSKYRVDENFVVPNGESYNQFADRVCEAFEDITRRGEGEVGDICIVAHGGVLDCIKNTYLASALPEDDHRCANASLCKITWVEDGGNSHWRVDEWNCTKHLVGVRVQQVVDDII
ncbi:hypothetical protein BASA81_012122 [Batrachochytrium salamandrivorans]|nr:hypothetical protein BASA81_012122 [Batrachochytrium salamandrivorans]